MQAAASAGNDAVMAAETITRGERAVIRHMRCQPSTRRHAMAIIAFQSGLFMRQGLANRQRAIMTAGTGADDMSMIDILRQH